MNLILEPFFRKNVHTSNDDVYLYMVTCAVSDYKLNFPTNYRPTERPTFC